MSSQREYHGLRSMHPRFTSQSREARPWTIGNAMRFFERCMMAQVSSHSGLGDGVRFMKKNFP